MKLLDRLREVDPTMHADICEILELLEYEGVPVSLDGLIANWIVQGAVQRAIERHGDDWGVSKDGHYIADIWVNGNVSDDDCSGHGDSPAEALLSAYIDLMEAKK